MTNFEKYKDAILEITKHGHGFGLVNNKITDCYDTGCNKCEFDGACNLHRFNWLYSEYREPIKLTKREWYFLTLVGNGYIARDGDEDLMWYEEKPYRDYNHEKQFWDTKGEYNEFYGLNLNQMFPFITWESEPWSVEDLLKLEVEE